MLRRGGPGSREVLKFMSVQAVFLQIFGPDNPNRFWLIAVIACVAACLPRGSRRAGGIGLCVLGGMLSISVFIHSVVTNYTPH